MKNVLLFYIVTAVFLFGEHAEEYERAIGFWETRTLPDEVIESYASASTKDLVYDYISATPNSPLVSNAIKDELSKESRKNDLAAALWEIVETEKLAPEQSNHVPQLAKMVSQEFGLSVLENIIFQPSANSYNFYYLNNGIWRKELDGHPEVMERILRRLLEQEDLKVGEPEYGLWLDDIENMSNHRIGLRESEVENFKSLQRNEENRFLKKIKIDASKPSISLPWTIVVVLFVGILALLFKILKSKSIS